LNVSYPEYDPDRPKNVPRAREVEDRWEPDGARDRRSFSLRDALRIFE